MRTLAVRAGNCRRLRKGISLIALLRGIGVTALCSPELTGEWESKLKLMEQGGLQRKEFMAQIRVAHGRHRQQGEEFPG